jgi:hypothetical protein
MMLTRLVGARDCGHPHFTDEIEGSVMPVSKSKQRPDTWKNALGSAWNDTLAEPISHANKNWIACKYAVARSQEPCFTGSWVFILDGVEVDAPHSQQ